MQIICGIDEAGRGAVIGPLVLVGITINEKDNERLIQIKVKDSKQLTKAQREDLFDKIILISKEYKIIMLSPREIDNAVNGRNSLNLNWLEARYSANILNNLSATKAIIDCPTPNVSAYRNYIKRHLNNKEIEIYIEHKADLNHPIVSAASIIAKVTRDNEIKKLKKYIGIDFGSGYPSDPITIDFLKKNFNNYKEIFRKSWMTYKNFEELKIQKKLLDF